MNIRRAGFAILYFSSLLPGQTAAPTQTNIAAQPAMAATSPEYRDFSVRDFPVELGRNFAGLISTDNIKPVVFGGFATAAAFVPQKRMEGYFRDHSKPAIHEVGDVMGNLFFAGPAVGAAFVAGRFSEDAKFRSFSYSLAQGFIVDQSIVIGLKYAVSSERPNHESSTSFPSGHTSIAFTSATIASRYYGRKIGIPAYLLAGFIGYSRMADRAHRFTDVVAGAAVGYIVGRTVSRRAAFDPNRRINWNVSVPPGGGVGLSLQIRPPWEPGG